MLEQSKNYKEAVTSVQEIAEKNAREDLHNLIEDINKILKEVVSKYPLLAKNSPDLYFKLCRGSDHFDLALNLNVRHDKFRPQSFMKQTIIEGVRRHYTRQLVEKINNQ